MAYTKERKKLEKLSEKIAGLQDSDDKSLTIITDIYDQYSHTVRILKNKDAGTFKELYLNEFQQVKEFKRLLKVGREEDRQVNFNNYKTALSEALEKTIQAANNTV